MQLLNLVDNLMAFAKETTHDQDKFLIFLRKLLVGEDYIPNVLAGFVRIEMGFHFVY